MCRRRSQPLQMRYSASDFSIREHAGVTEPFNCRCHFSWLRQILELIFYSLSQMREKRMGKRGRVEQLPTLNTLNSQMCLSLCGCRTTFLMGAHFEHFAAVYTHTIAHMLDIPSIMLALILARPRMEYKLYFYVYVRAVPKLISASSYFSLARLFFVRPFNQDNEHQL